MEQGAYDLLGDTLRNAKASCCNDWGHCGQLVDSTGYATCKTGPCNDKLPIQNASGTPQTEPKFLILQMKKDLNDFCKRDLGRFLSFCPVMSVCISFFRKKFPECHCFFLNSSAEPQSPEVEREAIFIEYAKSYIMCNI